LEIPVPRYFKEDDRIPVEIDFTEKIERDEGKKKKKKKKKKKGKKKGDDDDNKKKEPVISLEEKTQLVNALLERDWSTSAPEVEIVHDPFTLDMDIISAIRLVQKNERGR